MWRSQLRVPLLLIGCVLCFYVGRYLLYEQVEVPSVDESAAYDYASEEAMGLGLLVSILEDTYNKVDIVDDLDLSGEIDTTTLHIVIGQDMSITETLYDSLARRIIDGEHYLLSSPQINLYGSDDLPHISGSYMWVDTIDVWLESLLHRYIWPYGDQVSSIDHLASVYIDTEGQGVRSDSLSLYLAGDGLGADLDSTRHDSWLYYIVYTMGEGSLAVHSMPILLTNRHLQDDHYVPHINKLLAHYPHTTSIQLHRYMGLGRASIHPLSYLMTLPGIKYAIYLMLVGILLYILNGRRRQRSIPLVAPVQNTSMDFVRSMGRLYMSQDSGWQIANKIIHNFYAYVYDRYRLRRQNPRFWELLRAKSGAAEHIVDQIKSYTLGHTHTSTKLQVGRLHMILSKFYDQAH